MENTMILNGRGCTQYCDNYTERSVRCEICGIRGDHDEIYVTNNGDNITFPLNVCEEHRIEIEEGRNRLFEAGNKCNVGRE